VLCNHNVIIIGSDQPSIQDITDHVLLKAAAKWKELGENLSLKLHVLQNIGAQHGEVTF